MARPPLGDSATERFHMAITTDEITEIDNWRYANRIPTRSKAVRQLIKIGLLTPKYDLSDEMLDALIAADGLLQQLGHSLPQVKALIAARKAGAQ